MVWQPNIPAEAVSGGARWFRNAWTFSDNGGMRNCILAQEPIAPRRRTIGRRGGFSLLELAVVLLILVVLVAISLPTLTNMRALSRRRNCEQNLTTIVLALNAYATESGHFPVGTLSYDISHGAEPAASVESVRRGYHHNWLIAILPGLERQDLYEHIDADQSVYAPTHDLLRSTPVSRLLCPSASGMMVGTSTYAGISGGDETPLGVRNQGLMIADQAIAPEDAIDGLTYTMLLSEKLSPPEFDLSWMSGTRSSLRHTGLGIHADVSKDRYLDPLFVGSLSSRHLDGVNAGMGDGSIKFLHQGIEPSVLRSMANRRDQAGQDATGSRELAE